MLRIILSLLLAAALVSGGAIPNKFKKLRPDGRIIGGDLATIEDNPWQVSLESFGIHSCGGSIIGPTTILTAAHCIDPLMPLLYEVVVGSADLTTGTRLKIASAIAHEEYVGMGNDVGLIELAEPLVFSDTIQAIVLADAEPADGEVVRVSGWGVTSEWDILTPNLLYAVEVNVVNRDECTADYADVEDAIVDDTMICAGVPEGGKDSCAGDSGGPLTYNNQLVGIVSWGVGCAAAEYPGVYTSVPSMRAWIKENSGI